MVRKKKFRPSERGSVGSEFDDRCHQGRGFITLGTRGALPFGLKRTHPHVFRWGLDFTGAPQFMGRGGYGSRGDAYQWRA